MAKLRSVSRELIVHGENASFSVLNRLFPRFEFYLHNHPELEFDLIVSGRGLRYIGDNAEDFAPGDAVFIGENTPHTYSSKGPCRSICVQFHPGLFGPVFERSVEAAELRALFEKARHGLQLTGPLRKKMILAMKAMERLPIHSLRRVQLLFDLLVSMAEAPASEKRVLSVSKWENAALQSDEPDVRELLRYLHSEEPRNLQQKEVAKALHLSPTTFSHWFTKKFGRNYLAYINEVKVSRACRDLMETDLQIIEVALRSGFESHPTFIRQFKAIKKMTPSDYRRQIRRGQ
ncbi:MAG: helix-turn-helix domain-containing protein [Spirochaetia bacterium]|nr:helix-turn-helix domain-containing protein [Spirochaetia bacterium]